MRYLNDAVQSNWIAPVGPHVDVFEHELGFVINTKHVLVTNSGTSAIHLALLALGVGKGDEVVCSTLTFCASVNPVIYCGGTPLFIDSEKETWNMDPLLLAEAIQDRITNRGKKPKAIILVHLYGMPSRIREILEIAHKYQIPVLEDAAEALGSLYDGTQVGTFGEAGVLSFNGNKIITTSAGGALFSDDAALIEKARYFAQEAKEPLPYYEHKDVGYNYRLSNLLAAVGRSQLKVLRERVEKRRAIFDYYRSALYSVSALQFQPEAAGSRSNRWLTVIEVENGEGGREAIRLALADEDIESRPVWKPMHLQPVFKGFPAYVNGISEKLFHHGLCLPSGTALEFEDLDRVVSVVKSVMA